MSFVHVRRRALIAAAVALSVAAPLVSAGPAGADAIGDKQAQAREIAGQLSDLQHEAEANSEAYNAAVVKLQNLEDKVDVASKKVSASNAEMAKRREQVAQYAVGDYVQGGNGGVLPMILKSDGTDMGQRQGYADVAIGNREDLVNSLNAAKDDAEHQVAALDKAKSDAQDAKDAVQQKKDDTEAAVAKTQALNDQVQGELATLVQQEQARQAEAQRQAAEARAKAQAEAARAAAPPAAPASVPAPTSTTTTTTTAPSGGGGNQSTTTTTTTTAPRDETPAPAPAPAPAAPMPSGGGGGGIVGSAQSVLGTPYVWGGSSPGGFDCSGLVYWAYQQNGREVPRVATDQMHASQIIPLSALQPGDLVFYGGDSSYVNHVAIYVGGGQIIHAPNSGSVVRYDSLYYWDAIVAAGRL